MKTKGQANSMIIIMITVILAMVAISVAWGLIRSQQDRTAIIGDIFTATDGICVRITDNCFVIGSLSVLNSTDTATDATGNFSECGIGNDIYGALGDLSTAGKTGDTYNASYTEEACSRITGLTGTIIDYIPLLMAVLILIFVAGFAIK